MLLANNNNTVYSVCVLTFLCDVKILVQGLLTVTPCLYVLIPWERTPSGERSGCTP